MTVYEIPNIEHCTVEEIGDPVIGYGIYAHEGWYIHLNDGDEETANLYKGAVIIRAIETDYLQVQIIAAEDLPPDAEIANEEDKPVIA